MTNPADLPPEPPWHLPRRRRLRWGSVLNTLAWLYIAASLARSAL